MNKIVDYMAVASSDLKDLADAVKIFLLDGWVPTGGIAILPESDITYLFFYQAMVKYEENNGAN